MRYQNKQRYPPIANAKPLPTLLQRGAAATANEIAKEAANEEDEPPPGHRHGACRSNPPPMPGERRQKAHHRNGTTVAEFFSPEFGASVDGLEQYPPVSAMTPTLDREAPGPRTTGSPQQPKHRHKRRHRPNDVDRTSLEYLFSKSFPSTGQDGGSRAARSGRGPAIRRQPHPSRLNV